MALLLYKLSVWTVLKVVCVCATIIFANHSSRYTTLVQSPSQRCRIQKTNTQHTFRRFFSVNIIMPRRSLNRCTSHATYVDVSCTHRTNLSQNCHNKLQIVPTRTCCGASAGSVAQIIAQWDGCACSGRGCGGSFAKRSVARNRAISHRNVPTGTVSNECHWTRLE